MPTKDEEPRECGPCRMCCKLDGVWCKEVSEKGCAIHDAPSRPETCKLYSCAWKLGALLPDARPDKTKVLAVFEKSSNGKMGLACYTEYAQAFGTKRHRNLRLAALRKGMVVSEKVGQGETKFYRAGKGMIRRAPEKGEDNAD